MERPAQEDEYFDRWIRQYSEAVKTNMCTYFEWFKIKMTDETKEFCKTLPGKYEIAMSFKPIIKLIWSNSVSSCLIPDYYMIKKR